MFRKVTILHDAATEAAAGYLGRELDENPHPRSQVMLEVVTSGSPTFSIQPEQSMYAAFTVAHSIGSAISSAGLSEVAVQLPFFRARLVSFVDDGATTNFVTVKAIDTAVVIAGAVEVGAAVEVTNFPASQVVSATALGAQADVAWTTGSGSVIALLKGVVGKLAGTLQATTVNNSTAIQVTPTVTIGAYTTGMAVGGLLTLANAVVGTSGRVTAVTATFKSGAVQDMDFVFYHTTPSGSVTDHLGLAVVSGDLAKIVGFAHATEKTLLGTPSIVQAQGISIPFVLPTGTTLYAVAVIRGSTSLGATDDMTVTVRIEQD